VEDKYFACNGAKSWPWVWFGSITTIDSKCASCVVKSAGKRLPELASLDQRRGRCQVNRPERTILGDRGMSGDHFGACVVNFGGHMRY